MNLTRISVVSFTALAASLFGASAYSQTATDCTPIAAGRYTISTSGKYCLTQTVLTDANGIVIDADDVTIDLNGHTLRSHRPGLPAAFVYGIVFRTGAANQPRTNVTIRNGTITGFYGGIWLYRISNVLIEGVRIEGNPHQQSTGIALLDPRSPSVIKNNQMNAVALGVNARNAVGTVVEGNAIEIMGNYPTGTAGVTFDGVSSGSVVRNNRISNVSGLFGNGIGFNNNTQNGYVADNSISSVNYGITLGNVTNKYRNNVVSAANVPYLNGTDLGGNR